MTAWIFLIIATLLALLSANIGKVYRQEPAKKLKHQARGGDKQAGLLHMVAQYGAIAEIVFWTADSLFVSLAAASSRYILPTPIALLFIFSLIVLVFVMVPASRTSQRSRWLAARCAPQLARFLMTAGPVLSKVRELMHLDRSTSRTGLYDQDDIVELLEKQKADDTNRVDRSELDLLLNSLAFGEKTIAQVMTPRRKIRFVAGNEPVGPILTTELHDSGFSQFPVTGEDQQIIGTLYLSDLVEFKKAGVVKNVMKPDVYYVNQTQKLDHVLSAFIRTKHHFFMVVNQSEEVVGLITIEDILAQIVGHEIVQTFDAHEDRHAAAALQVKQDSDKHSGPEVVE